MYYVMEQKVVTALKSEKYLFGGISVETEHSYDFITYRCHDYKTSKPSDISIKITEEDIDFEAAMSKTEATEEAKGYLEFLSLYRKFCDKAAEKGIILMHGCAVATEGKAFVFTAPSGTGKTTHARLWLELLGDKAFVLNGDKPLIDMKTDIPTVYGTPWDGKEHLSRNTNLPLGGIVLIERSESNSIEPIGSGDALKILLSQCYRPNDPDVMQHVLNSLIKLSGSVKFYKLKCNISKEAAMLSHSTLIKDDINEA